MTRPFLLWAGIILAAAAVLRLSFLSVRPMHTDEAVQAVKFGRLLEAGEYVYDPLEYHGPTLHYTTLIFARFAGRDTLAELTDSFLRAVPACFGILTVLLPLLFWKDLGCRAAIFASVLLACSPAFVFYSRYYIHESLLVFFLGCFLGCLWRYKRTQKPGWAILTGLSAGLMVATKETCILAFGSVVLSLLLVRVLPFRYSEKDPDKPRTFRPVSFLLAVFALLSVWALLFSSFGTHPQGLADSIRSYLVYPAHASNLQIHTHPWWYYLDLLTWVEFFEPIAWNEDGIVALGLLGFFIAFFSRHKNPQFLRFLAIFTLILTILYSAIPYKTPWNVMPFLYGMALLAGVVGDRFLQMASGKIERYCVAAVLLIFGVISPLAQSVFLNTRFACDPSNPYIYGHTGEDILKMTQKIQTITDAVPDGKDLYVQVIASNDDYWPWPWYFRRFSHVGYWNHVDPNQSPAPLILADADMEPEILKWLYEVPPPGQRNLYLPLFDSAVFLRPGVEWEGYIRKDLWDQAMQSRQGDETPVETGMQNGFIEPLRETGKEAIRFSHQAMATVFEVFIQHDDSGYASKAARAAFEEADHLESLLSRYIPNSDISRIAALKKGESIIVSPETMECLLIARRLYEQTNGAFDITVGGMVELWKEGIPTEEQVRKVLQTVGMNLLELDPEKMSVTVGADSMVPDLGGVGKGYTVGQMARILREWNIEKALIHAGSSSVLALHPPAGQTGWTVRLRNPSEPEKDIRLLEMRNEALSCSGLRRQTDMIHPATGKPIQDKTAVWVKGADTAICDGLSTAFMVMSVEEIEQYSRSHPEIMILVLEKTGNFLQFGF